jgi:hypothetical protein
VLLCFFQHQDIVAISAEGRFDQPVIGISDIQDFYDLIQFRPIQITTGPNSIKGCDNTSHGNLPFAKFTTSARAQTQSQNT